MANVTNDKCEERRETIFTMVHSKLPSKLFWTVVPLAILIGGGLLAIIYAKANGNTKANQENAVAVARVEEKVEEGFKRVDQHLTRQGEDIKELLREAKK